MKKFERVVLASLLALSGTVSAQTSDDSLLPATTAATLSYSYAPSSPGTITPGEYLDACKPWMSALMTIVGAGVDSAQKSKALEHYLKDPTLFLQLMKGLLDAVSKMGNPATDEQIALVACALHRLGECLSNLSAEDLVGQLNNKDGTPREGSALLLKQILDMARGNGEALKKTAAELTDFMATGICK